MVSLPQVQHQPKNTRSYQNQVVQVVVGCKQDLERVDLPYVEIEAMVTITSYSTTLTLLILRLAWTGNVDTLNVVALMAMGSLECSGKQIFIFCHIVNF